MYRWIGTPMPRFRAHAEQQRPVHAGVQGHAPTPKEKTSPCRSASGNPCCFGGSYENALQPPHQQIGSGKLLIKPHTFILISVEVVLVGSTTPRCTYVPTIGIHVVGFSWDLLRNEQADELDCWLKDAYNSIQKSWNIIDPNPKSRTEATLAEVIYL